MTETTTITPTNPPAVTEPVSNTRYGTNHKIGEFDLYYQDVQKRIKDQQWPYADLPHAQKIDIPIVVDMLLTGFDSKYLNTLYVDKASVVIKKLEDAVKKLDGFMKTQGLDCAPEAGSEIGSRIVQPTLI